MKIYKYRHYKPTNFGIADPMSVAQFVIEHPNASNFLGRHVVSPAIRTYRKIKPALDTVKAVHEKIWDNKPMQFVRKGGHVVGHALKTSGAWLGRNAINAGKWVGSNSVKAAQATGRGLATAGAAVADKAVDAWDATRDARSGVGHWIADKPGQAWKAVTGGLRGMWQGFKTTGFPGLITGAIGGAAGGWVGQRKKQRLFRALREKAGYMTDEQLKAIAENHINPDTLSENWADKLGKPFDIQA